MGTYEHNKSFHPRPLGLSIRSLLPRVLLQSISHLDRLNYLYEDIKSTTHKGDILRFSESLKLETIF